MDEPEYDSEKLVDLWKHLKRQMTIHRNMKFRSPCANKGDCCVLRGRDMHETMAVFPMQIAG